MIYTIDVKTNAEDKFMWLLQHFQKEATIISEYDDTEVTKDMLIQREKAQKDFQAGNTISEEEFAKEFFSDL